MVDLDHKNIGARERSSLYPCGGAQESVPRSLGGGGNLQHQLYLSPLQQTSQIFAGGHKKQMLTPAVSICPSQKMLGGTHADTKGDAWRQAVHIPLMERLTKTRR